MKLTTENMNKLLTWQGEGRRCFEITKDCLDGDEVKIWVYDYDVGEGERVVDASDLPTKLELLELKDLRLTEKLKELNEQMIRNGGF